MTKIKLADLLAAAEMQLLDKPITKRDFRTAEELLHELQVHQIELEMQNEQLRFTQVNLEESLSRYVDLYDFAPVGYVLLSDKGIITEANHTTAKLLGYVRSQLLSRRFASFISMEDGDRWHLFSAKFKKDKEESSIELSLKDSQGAEFPVLLNCLNINSTIRISITDVSKIKQAEAKAIIEAEYSQNLLDSLQKIYNSVPGLIYQYLLRPDSSHCFPFASETLFDICRLHPIEIRDDASKAFALIHPDDLDGFITSIHKSAQKLTPWYYEFRIKFDDGTVRWLLGNSVPHLNGDGSILWHGCCFDITEHKLLENNQKLKDFALNAISQGVIITRPDHSIFWANKAFETITGYELTEILNLNCRFLQGLLTNPETIRNISRALKNQTQFSGEILNYRKDGTAFWNELTINPIFDQQGRLTNFISTTLDITQRKYQEQQDKDHLDQLAHVTRLGLMGEMASGIAHEVNQPLTAIATYAQVSLNLINRKNPDLIKLADVAAKTQDQALRAGQIIHGVKRFCKATSQKRIATDINELINDSANLCADSLKQNCIKLTLELTDNLPLIHIDHIQIEQFILNLIRNGIDAILSTSEKGLREIIIQSYLTPNNEIQVRVKDNGSGIEEDQQAQILMPFHTTKSDGMGMGLSISRSLIEAHNGTLNFNSQFGKGSTFYITLPIIS
jgi:PAS domain S-box-containing protein